MTKLQQIGESLTVHGLALRGGFHPGSEDAAPVLPDGRVCGTILLLGNLGGGLWPVFAESAELADGAPHALDRWTRRILESLAPGFGATPLFPFGGPPWLPFQRWAIKADCVAPSPLGILIHPDFGLWHAYRGALAFGKKRRSLCRQHAGNDYRRRHVQPFVAINSRRARAGLFDRRRWKYIHGCRYVHDLRRHFAGTSR